MAYTGINKSSLHMNTKLYTGNGGTQSITGVGFQPDLVWIKKRNTADDHNLVDAVRGVTKYLQSNTNIAEATYAGNVSAFGTDGFTVGDGNQVNQNTHTFASWNWKAGTAVSGNTGGSGSYKTYSGSVDTTAGFSIIKYTGNGSAGHTIPHHLGSAPSMVICKSISENRGFPIQHVGLTSAAYAIYLSSTGTQANNPAGGGTNTWNSTAASSSVVTLGNNANNNANNQTYIMYSFSQKTGYSKFGSYVGNGSTDGPFIYTGFKPAFFITKKTSAAGSWYMYDNKRAGGSNVNDDAVLANTNDGEFSSNIDFLSNGVKIKTSGSGENLSGGSFIYMAFGQSLVGSNNVPCTAR
jgi:hypothetical protein